MGLKSLINSENIRAQFALALPRHLSVDRFIRIATTALIRTPDLVDCTKESFMKCLLELSAWGIEADGRRAHLIPFKDRKNNVTICTLILDWKGLAELAQRSGEIAKLHADLICENDEFEYNLGEIIHHRIDFKEERGKPYAAYARAVTKDGATYVSVMTKGEILSVRNGSQGWIAFEKGFTKQSPWDPRNPTSEGEMWKKTAFRRLSKWLPLSAEFRDAIEKEDAREIRDVTPDQTLTIAPEPEAIPFALEAGAADPEEFEQASEPEPLDKVSLIHDIRHTCREAEITEASFEGKARGNGWMDKGQNLASLTDAQLTEVWKNRESIAKGEKKP